MSLNSQTQDTINFSYACYTLSILLSSLKNFHVLLRTWKISFRLDVVPAVTTRQPRTWIGSEDTGTLAGPIRAFSPELSPTRLGERNQGGGGWRGTEGPTAARTSHALQRQTVEEGRTTLLASSLGKLRTILHKSRDTPLQRNLRELAEQLEFAVAAITKG